MRAPTLEPERLIPELERYRERIESARSAVQNLITGLTGERFVERPVPGAWSISECLDHLCRIGTAISPRLSSAIEKAGSKGWRARGPFHYGTFGSWFVRQATAGSLPPRRALKTPKLYEPVPERLLSEVVPEFEEVQTRFLEIVRSTNGLDLARIKITSPASRLVRLSLGQWLDLISGHQERHLWQARTVRRALGGDGS